MAKKAGKGTTFTITGVKEIQRAYRELPKRIANKVIRKAIRTALKPVKAKAEELAPQGDTLKLSKSFRVRARKKVKRGVIALNVQTGEGNFRGETYYGGMVNFGTKKQKAQGFMEKAFDATKDTAASQVAGDIAEGTVREAKNLARG